MRRTWMTGVAAMAILAVTPLMVLAQAKPPTPTPAKPIKPKTVAAASQPTTALSLGKPSPVLKEIPAGALGYAVIGNPKKTVDSVEKYIGDLGLGMMLQGSAPNGLWNLIVQEGQLGDGIKPERGIAVVVLDPKPLGVDMAKAIKQAMDDEDPDPAFKAIPWVLYIPADSIDSLSPKLKDEPKETVGRFVRVGKHEPPMFAFEQHGFVLLSTSEKTLAAAVDANGSAAEVLDKNQLALIAKDDVAFYINAAVATPTLVEVFDLLQKKVSEAASQESDQAASPRFASFQTQLQSMQKDLEQVRDMTIGLAFGADGIILEQLCDFKPTSPRGKALAASKGSAVPPVGKVNDADYILTIGVGGVSNLWFKDVIGRMDDGLTAMLTSSGKPLSEKTSASLRSLTDRYGEQITGFQMVAGAPAEEGVFGVTFLMECKDATKVQALLAEEVDLCNAMISELGAGDEDVTGLKVEYRKDGLAQGVDVIEITHPKMDEMPPQARTMMKSVLADDRFRMLVAQADANTVVVTFGGGKSYLDLAVKTAKEGGKLPADQGIALTTKYMPRNMTAFGAFNIGNLFKVIRNGVTATGGNGNQFPFQINSTTPITFGTGILGSMQHTVVFIPTEPVKEVAQIVMGFMMMRGMGGGEGPESPGNQPTSRGAEEF